MTEETEPQDGKGPQEFKHRWEPYIREEVTLTIGNTTYNGILNEPNFKRNYIDLLPHVLFEADGESCYLEDKIPARISLDQLMGPGVTLISHRKGYLQARVDFSNALVAKRRKNKLGFGQGLDYII